MWAASVGRSFSLTQFPGALDNRHGSHHTIEITYWRTRGAAARVRFATGMINYTERLTVLMEDIVARVPTLSFIDVSRTLVFARAGRSGAEGAYATCHCLSLPDSEPGYYFWRDRNTGRLTRRSEWFVTKSPAVTIGTMPIDYMFSFALPRFCDQQLSRSRKQAH